ncbi:sugar transferase, partial [Campylobacter jejuni]|nr:sugar transferase [Campylobacter jejuni]EJB4702721.1 sugar transferase [Campylobacter jejuni]EKK7213698.1 sugar transferase [Campylobacter jejuni]ELB3160154.1 sugar transferase [Campylobacter jejuni]ELJ9526221.1 sugar transferase [Campylobacter jejuni]
IDLDRFDIRTKISEDIYYFANDMENVSSIFSYFFLKKYYITDYKIQANHGFKLHSKIRTFDEIKSPPFENEWGWYSTDIPPYYWLKDCKKEEFLCIVRDIYNNKFIFSSDYQQIFDNVNVINEKINNFIALHIRGGDIVYSSLRKHAGRKVLEERFFPYEIALEIIKRHTNANVKIIIFGQDVKSNMKLLNYIIENKILPKNKIFTVDEFINQTFSSLQRAFFEINLMSKAYAIYSPKVSAFSRTAMMISGKDILIAYEDIFNAQERYDIIQRNLFSLGLNDLQIARSLFYQYTLSLKLKMPLNICLEILKKALYFDRDNDAYRIYIIDNLFQTYQYELINRYLKIILNNRYDCFLKTLCDNSLNVFCDYYKKYLNQSKNNFFYIKFVAAYISIYKGDVYCALQYLDELISMKQNNTLLLKLIDKIKYNLCYNGELRLKGTLQYKLGQVFLNIFTKSNIIDVLFFLIRYKKEKKKIELFIQNFNINIPSFEQCYDYSNAKRIEYYLSYNIGKIMIQAHQSWYKGAYFILPYKIYILYKNFKHKKGK